MLLILESPKLGDGHLIQRSWHVHILDRMRRRRHRTGIQTTGKALRSVCSRQEASEHAPPAARIYAESTRALDRNVQF